MKYSLLKSLSLLSALVLMIALAGCGGSGPSATVEGFMEAAKDKDCAKMVDYLDIEAFQTPGETVTREQLISLCEEGGLDDIVSYKILEEKVDGDTAEVKVEATGRSDGEEETNTSTLNLVKRDGEWKLSAL